MIVISDTTPILSLLKADKLDLLEKLYHKIVVPEAVYDEMTSNADFLDEREKIVNCSFLSAKKISNEESVKILRNVTGLDAGESEALVLYGEIEAELLLIDERKGRNVAKKMSVKHVGTMGVLMQAFDEGIVSAEEIRKILEILLASNIRLSRKLCNKVLDYVGQEGL